MVDNLLIIPIVKGVRKGGLKAYLLVTCRLHSIEYSELENATETISCSIDEYMRRRLNESSNASQIQAVTVCPGGSADMESN